jgi:hypothetical protein
LGVVGSSTSDSDGSEESEGGSGGVIERLAGGGIRMKNVESFQDLKIGSLSVGQSTGACATIFAPLRPNGLEIGDRSRSMNLFVSGLNKFYVRSIHKCLTIL